MDECGLMERLAAQLYEGVLADGGWSEALRTISEVTRSPQASMIVSDARMQVSAIHEGFGMSEAAAAAYNDHYHLLDTGRPMAGVMAVGSWYLDRRDIGERAMQRSTFYQDFLLRHDMATILCNRVLGEGDVNAHLSLQRRPGQPHYTDADLAAFGQFIPHVQRAARLRMHMQRLAQRAGLASVMLDQLRMALLVLDEQGHLLLANAEADALLRRHPRQLAVRHGCLHPQGLRAGQFPHLLQSACGRQGPAIAGGALLPDAQGRLALQLLVLPLPVRLQAFNSWARPLALVVLNEPDRPHGTHQGLLQQLYGLTPAETRLAQVLCQGDTLTEAAQRLGVSVGTVRAQLRAIFAKTGTSRQSSLIRMLAALHTVG